MGVVCCTEEGGTRSFSDTGDGEEGGGSSGGAIDVGTGACVVAGWKKDRNPVRLFVCLIIMRHGSEYATLFRNLSFSTGCGIGSIHCSKRAFPGVASICVLQC